MADEPSKALRTTAGKLAARSWLRPGVTTTRRRRAIALGVAAIADVLQIAIFPAFIEGAASPFDDALNAVVVITLLTILDLR